MFGLIGKLLLVLLAAIGLTTCGKNLVKWVMCPKSAKKITVILDVQGHDESIEDTLRSVISQYQWFQENRDCQILCVDRHMDGETRFICDKISQRYPFVQICSPEQAAKQMVS